MKEEIKSCGERVEKLLEMTPPKGEIFLNKIEHILKRERNWVWWKRDGCPPFVKQPMDKKVIQEGAKKWFNFIRCFFLLPNVSQIIFIEPLGRLCLTEWIADCLLLASVLALWKCSGWPYSNPAHPT